MLNHPGPTALETTLASHPDAAAELVLPLLADPDRPVTSLDDPRVPERVRWACEQFLTRVLTRLKREAACRERPDGPDTSDTVGRLAG